MRYYDRKIEQAIRKEHFTLPSGYEEKLQDTLQQLKMEEEECSGIMKRFWSRRRKHRMIMAVVPAMLAVIVCVGAGRLQKYIVVDLWGNVTSENANSDDFDWDALQAYADKNVSYGRFLKYSSVMMVGGPYVPWQDIEEEEEAERLRLQAVTKIHMPSELPGGYRFSKAQVMFYLEKDAKECVLESTEKKGQCIYQIFRFPKGFEENVQGLVYDYETEDGHFLRCQAILLNNGGTLFDTDSSVRDIEVKGYESAQEITEEDETYLMMTQKISPVEPENDIFEWGKEEYFQYLKKHHVPFAFKWKEMYEEDDTEDGTDMQEEEETEDLTTYYYISYQLSSDVLSGKQLQKIAEGMQAEGNKEE